MNLTDLTSSNFFRQIVTFANVAARLRGATYHRSHAASIRVENLFEEEQSGGIYIFIQILFMLVMNSLFINCIFFALGFEL